MQFVVKVTSLSSGKALFLRRFRNYAEAYAFYMELNRAIFFDAVLVKLLTADYELISCFESTSPDEIRNR